MKFKQTILAGIVMLLLSLSVHAELITSVQGNTITATTDKQAVAGYKGCKISTAKEVPAYVFDLQIKKTGKKGTCSRNNVGKWSSFNRITSEENSVVFDQLPQGKYRVVCYSGTAIGCTLEGDTKDLPNKSIVYEKETSGLINLNQESSILSKISNSESDELKVFPNPATSEFTVQLENGSLENEVNLSILNLLGQAVESYSYPLDGNSKSHSWIIDSSNYSTGAYIITLTDKSGKSLQKKILIMNE